MKHTTLTALALALTASGGAYAGGLDRSGQSVMAVFAADGSASLTFGQVMPSITGTDATGADYDVGEDYTQVGFSYTNRINDKLSYAMIFDQPYGANVNYGTDPATTMLGGTMADLSSSALTMVGRYAITDRISVFAGVGLQQIEAAVNLNGLAYRQAITLSGAAEAIPGIDATTLGAAVSCEPAAAAAGLTCSAFQPLAAGAVDTATGGNGAATIAATAAALTGFDAAGGYRFSMDSSNSANYLVGAAYEIPDIALRIAATYRFETDHSANTVEHILGTTTNGTIDYVTPQSFNLEAQTGIAEGTLLTASFRWTEFSAVDLVPVRLGSDLVNLDDSKRYSVGIARRFNEKLAGSVTLSYEPEGDGATVSPLGPTDGLFGISLGGRYTDGAMNISGGINYSWLGDADAGVADQAVASFTDNHVVGIGIKMEMSF